jgi:hypothetical protein
VPGERACPTCGATFPAGPRAVYCSRECRLRAQAARATRKRHRESAVCRRRELEGEARRLCAAFSTAKRIRGIKRAATAKEWRLFVVMLTIDFLGGVITVRDLCLVCHTTPKTLLYQTWPGLRSKTRRIIAW